MDANNLWYLYPQVDPKVAFPRKAQPKVRISYMYIFVHVLVITSFRMFSLYSIVDMNTILSLRKIPTGSFHFLSAFQYIFLLKFHYLFI